jgi:hypothetical protein
LSSSQRPPYMRPFNLTGQSALSLCNGFDRPVCPRRRLNASMNYGIRNDLIVATAASGNSSWIDSFPCGSSLSSAPGAAAKAVHLGARSWGCSIAVDDKHRHVCAPRQVKKGRAAFNAVEGTGDEANGGVPRPGRAGHRQLRGQAVAAQPTRILVDMVPRHPDDDEPAHIQPVKQRADGPVIDGTANAGEPRALTTHHRR